MEKEKKLPTEREQGGRKANVWLMCLPSIIMSIIAIIISIAQLLK